MSSKCFGHVLLFLIGHVFIFWNVLDVFFGNMHVLMFFVLLLDLCLERCECMFLFFLRLFLFFPNKGSFGNLFGRL